ncbi:MAG: OmpA family protein [Actinobacteria bacterium]|nr:OmpA family protein [Actinomycetota bacterium]
MVSSDNELNYWPSFVDLMSSIFIVILIIFFILFLSQQYLSYLVSKGENDLIELRNLVSQKEIEGVRVNSDGRITIGEKVLFSPGQHILTVKGKYTVENIGKILRDFLRQERKRKFSVIVEGHTDTKASSEFNLDLSFRRAKEVTDFWQRWLKFGVETDSLLDIFPAGYGENRLYTYTKDEVSNESNRRVEIRVVPKFDEMLSEILKTRH